MTVCAPVHPVCIETATEPQANTRPGPGRVTHHDLVATGVTYRQIDHWTTCGLLDVDTPNPGSGRQRTYPASEVTVVAVMARLTDAGIPPSVAVLAARNDGWIAPGVRIVMTCEHVGMGIYDAQVVTSAEP